MTVRELKNKLNLWPDNTPVKVEIRGQLIEVFGTHDDQNAAVLDVGYVPPTFLNVKDGL